MRFSPYKKAGTLRKAIAKLENPREEVTYDSAVEDFQNFQNEFWENSAEQISMKISKFPTALLSEDLMQLCVEHNLLQHMDIIDRYKRLS